MAYERLDRTENEASGRTIAKIARMLKELYASVGTGAASVTSLVASGVVTAGGLLTGASFKLDTGTKTAAATAGAATLNKSSGVITSEALTTAAGATYTLTVTDSAVAAADMVFGSVANGTNTQGQPDIETITPGAGSVVIVVRNRDASQALNGTLKIAFAVLKA